MRVTVTEDLRPFVKFVGRTTRGGDSAATFFNQAENRITKLRVGEPFSLAGVSGEVLEIGRDTLEFARDGRRYRLAIGQSLADAVDLGEQTAAVAAEAEPEAEEPEGSGPAAPRPGAGDEETFAPAGSD